MSDQRHERRDQPDDEEEAELEEDHQHAAWRRQERVGDGPVTELAGDAEDPGEDHHQADDRTGVGDADERFVVGELLDRQEDEQEQREGDRQGQRDDREDEHRARGAQLEELGRDEFADDPERGHVGLTSVWVSVKKSCSRLGRSS